MVRVETNAPGSCRGLAAVRQLLRKQAGKTRVSVSFLSYNLVLGLPQICPTLFGFGSGGWGGRVRINDQTIVLLKFLKGCFSPFFGLHSNSRR